MPTGCRPRTQRSQISVGPKTEIQEADRNNGSEAQGLRVARARARSDGTEGHPPIRSACLPRTTYNHSFTPKEELSLNSEGPSNNKPGLPLLPMASGRTSWSSMATLGFHSLREIRKLERIQGRAKPMIKESVNRTQEAS